MIGVSTFITDPVTPDRLFVRSLLAAGVLISVWAALTGEPTWVDVVGGTAAVILAAALVASAGLAPVARHPITVTVVMLVAAVVIGVAFNSPATVWILYLGVFAALMAPVPVPVTAALTVVPVTMLAVRSWWLSHNLWSVGINLAIAGGLVVLIGMRRRQREADELAAAQQAVIDTERARAAAAERQRELAGQLHDVLAHTLSGLIVTLQGATLAARAEGVSPELSQRLQTATTLAKDGLHEARSAVESLRSVSSPDPQPSEPDLARWLAQTVARLAGDAEIEVVGTPSAIAPAWTALARSVLMEGVTNSLRHAAGAPIRISLAPDTVAVVSLGDPAGFRDLRHPSGGHGITGLTQRARAAGAHVESGVTAEGFALTLRLPGSNGAGGAAEAEA